MVWRRRTAAPAEPQTRWQQAESRWERWRRDPERRALWWKVACLGALGCNGLLTIGMVIVALQVKVKILPIVVSEPGQTVHKVGTLEDYAYTPSEEMLKKYVKDFVYWVRSVPRDEVVYRRQWEEAKKIASVPVQQAMRAYAEANNLRDLVKKNIAVMATVQPPFPLSDRTFQVDWTETVTAEREITSVWRGIFEVVVKPPTEPKERELNPLGIYIVWFKWQEQIYEKKDKLS